jgi:competence protein CoiA
MPFTALNKTTGKLITLFDYRAPLSELRQSEIVCPVCETEMIIRSAHYRLGRPVAAHFAHKPDTDCWYARETAGERYEHHLAKQVLSAKLREWFSEYTTAEPWLEAPIREVQRVADILFLFPGGWGIVHEIQLAGITPERLEERTLDYERAGLDVVWWFGLEAKTPNNLQWSMDRYGYAYQLDFESDQSAGDGNIILGQAGGELR